MRSAKSFNKSLNDRSHKSLLRCADARMTAGPKLTSSIIISVFESSWVERHEAYTGEILNVQTKIWSVKQVEERKN